MYVDAEKCRKLQHPDGFFVGQVINQKMSNDFDYKALISIILHYVLRTGFRIINQTKKEVI
ncbi:MAG: hypothetical protein CVU11_15715 [Bacteroidetes bacterium HGW-Bacteroidetes-6]|nr:MAG: hypothetical protein CVU11_15715 [Bacteroidetes bacterium HGW-Bacteroidetes-6]